MTILNRVLPGLILVGLAFSQPAALESNPAACPAGETGKASSRPAREEKTVRQKTEKEIFQEMCEFLEMDEQQTKEAEKLFEARINEIREIFSSAGSDKSSQKEALEKNAESFKKYREKFLNLLSDKQKKKLETREKQQTAKRN